MGVCFQLLSIFHPEESNHADVRKPSLLFENTQATASTSAIGSSENNYNPHHISHRQYSVATAASSSAASVVVASPAIKESLDEESARIFPRQASGVVPSFRNSLKRPATKFTGYYRKSANGTETDGPRNPNIHIVYEKNPDDEKENITAGASTDNLIEEEHEEDFEDSENLSANGLFDLEEYLGDARNPDDEASFSGSGTSITTTTTATKQRNNADEGQQLSVSSNGYSKPSYSYSCLIGLCLKNSPNGELAVSEIYTFMW